MREKKHGNKRLRGCNKGLKCKYFHPVLCEKSLNKGRCYDEKCTLVHVERKKSGNNSKDRSESEKCENER